MSAQSPLLRIATRGIRAHRARTVLVLAMIALPVLALTVSFTFIETERRTEDQFRRWTFGHADYIVDSPTRPTVKGATAASANAVQSQVGDSITRHDGRVRPVERLFVEPNTWRVLEPVYALRGSLPQADGEAAVSEAAASWAKVRIGDSLRFQSGIKSVTAIVRRRSDHNANFALTPTTNSPLEPDSTRWLVDVKLARDIPRVGADLASNDPSTLLINTRAAARSVGLATNAAHQEITYLIGAFALVETVFVASAAFAVGARRRVRELALLQAVGADATKAGHIVTIEGVLLGCFGVVIGLLGGFATATLTQGMFAATLEHDIDDLRFPWLLIIASAAAGLVAAMIAAELPARELRKLDVVSALGDRPVHSPASNKWGLLGLALVGLGSAGIWFAAAHGQGGRYTGRAVELGTILIVVGAACLTPIALHGFARFAHRLPLPMRFAMREADRSRRRSSFAVSSVMALVAAVVAISCFGTPRVQSGSARVATFLVTPNDQTQAIDAAAATAALTESAPKLNTAAYVFGFGRVGQGPARVEVSGEQRPAGPNPTGLRGFLILAVAPESLKFLDPSGAASTVLADNTVVFFNDDEEILADKASIVDAAGMIGELSVVAAGPFPRQIAAALDLNPTNLAVISVATMHDLNLVGGSLKAVATDAGSTNNPRPLTASEHDDIRAALERSLDAPVEAPLAPRGFTIDGIRSTLVLTGLLLAFAALAVAIALTAVESRRERSVLELIGMAPRNRRSLAGARAIVLGVTGGILGIPTGILPVLLLTKVSDGRFRFVEQSFQIDWSVLTLVAVVFPVVAGCAAWCWPSRPAQASELRMPT